jgi:uncharacterized protein YdaU (DUF1376 family)
MIYLSALLGHGRYNLMLCDVMKNGGKFADAAAEWRKLAEAAREEWRNKASLMLAIWMHIHVSFKRCHMYGEHKVCHVSRSVRLRS